MQAYKHVMVAVDGSKQAELAFKKGVAVAKRNNAKLILAHVIDTRAIQNVAAVDTFTYENLEKEANTLLDNYIQMAKEAGVKEVRKVIEFGNPKRLLAVEIPQSENIDLILLGATGLNNFERLLIGSSSEYIMRHAKVDILVVRDEQKTL
ncbi:universal stress protein [Streptococcus dentapri]|uniref:Universal stress protein n=1 Tax=Streptococcus dentapri TaxID=573564 RepID=A0ABV8D0U5_9STRE